MTGCGYALVPEESQRKRGERRKGKTERRRTVFLICPKVWYDGTVGQQPSRPNAQGKCHTYANRGQPHPLIRAVQVGPGPVRTHHKNKNVLAKRETNE